MFTKLSLGIIPLLAACSSSSPQVLSGRLAPGYPAGMTTVRAMHHTTILATAPLAADGSFQIAVPPSRDVTLQLVGASRSDVVFPRQSGTVERGFLIRGGGKPFALGTIRLGSPTTTFSFHNGTVASDCTDGVDANGETCIDDEGDLHDTCEAEDGSDSESADDTDNGAEADASAEAPDAGDSTAEHNFPSDGCSGDDGADTGTDTGSDTGSDTGA